MQIVIPMSGFGERFKQAGYEVPKPLIEVDGAPILEYVVKLFPGEKNFIFICNDEHLSNPKFRMREIISEICPSGKIVGIGPHKLGPVHAVLLASDQIDLELPTVVNYCDFTCYWDWETFKNFAFESSFKGIIPAYRGFHPHNLGSTQYAYLKTEGNIVKDIQEKRPFTSDRTSEWASTGTYYFSSGKLLLDACNFAVSRNYNVGGEYYVSLAYKYLFDSNLPVAPFAIQHFMQWGTPQDLSEYKSWSDAFRSLGTMKVPDIFSKHHIVMPMAGLGKRFSERGYKETKPLIKVSGAPMVLQSLRSLPGASTCSFVLRSDMPQAEATAELLRQEVKGAKVTFVPEVTEGQACTAKIGLTAIERGIEPDDLITMAACDTGLLYDRQALKSIFEQKEFDLLVWAAIGHSNAVRNPQMFGWLDLGEDREIRGVSVKKPLKDPAVDPIVAGIFTFRNAEVFNSCYRSMLNRNGMVNGEFYLDSLISDAIYLGYRCQVFEVQSYLSWGTPDDLETFKYWQSCFHKWNLHPYTIRNDFLVQGSNYTELEASF